MKIEISREQRAVFREAYESVYPQLSSAMKTAGIPYDPDTKVEVLGIMQADIDFVEEIAERKILFRAARGDEDVPKELLRAIIQVNADRKKKENASDILKKAKILTDKAKNSEESIIRIMNDLQELPSGKEKSVPLSATNELEMKRLERNEKIQANLRPEVLARKKAEQDHQKSEINSASQQALQRL